jgi:hypothetical protein
VNPSEYRDAVAHAWAELKVRVLDADLPPCIPRPSEQALERRALAGHVLDQAMTGPNWVRLLTRLQDDGIPPAAVAYAVAESIKALGFAGDVL